MPTLIKGFSMSLPNFAVTIDGNDVTSNMRPYLISVDVADKDGTSSDTCRLSFDDTGGQCQLPATGAKVAVAIEGATVFEGTVDSTPWRLTRGGGRILDVSAKGFDTRGKAKEKQLWHLDDATLGDALKKSAEKAGLTVTVDPALASIQRNYWAPDGASFLAWGHKLAKEHGATFKVRGDKAVFAKRGTGASGSGAAMPSVMGVVGRNVITVDIDPNQGRPSFAKKRVRYFDRASASYMEKSIDVESESETTDTARWMAADGDQADAIAEGGKTAAERDAGVGSVTMTLDVTAQAEGTFVLTGARPGIDGTYRITGVTHKADRNGGSSTTLELAQPSGGAGKDERKAG
jgi:phage protein D